MKTQIFASLFVVFETLTTAMGASLGTAFTYQGRLTDNGTPANGNYDLRFILYNTESNGSQVGNTLTNESVAVSNGLFSAALDFGTGVFDGSAYWLEVAVRTNGTSGAFALLMPRQALRPVPYALFAPNAGTAATAKGIPPGAVSVAQLNTLGPPGNDQVLGYNGTSLIWTNASTAAPAWTLNGNAGTMSGPNFIGTTDNQPLELKANGQRVLRLEPNSLGPNVIGGDASNYVAIGVTGATIAGGGSQSNGNTVSANYSTIGGGNANSIKNGAFLAIIGGGVGNLVDTNASLASICGGRFNKVSAIYATIGGGLENSNNGEYSTLAGGFNNAIEDGADYSIIAGGASNTIQTGAYDSAIDGGASNRIHSGSDHAIIAGGLSNTIRTNAPAAAILGGLVNTAAGKASLAAGQGANALHDGAFVWSDYLPTVPPNFASSATNEFAVRATGGVRFVSAVDSTGVVVAGVSLPAGSGSWVSLSDRNAKKNLRPVDGRAVLEKVALLSLSTWSYKSQDSSIRHIGPVAQDFYATFGLGEDERHIATVDADGVALAAIQALNQIVKEKDARISALEKQNASLETRLTVLEKLVAVLTTRK